MQSFMSGLLLVKAEQAQFDVSRLDEIHKINLITSSLSDKKNDYEKKYDELDANNEPQNIDDINSSLCKVCDFLISTATNAVVSESKTSFAPLVPNNVKRANFFIYSDISTRYLQNQVKLADLNHMCSDSENVRDSGENPTSQEVYDNINQLLDKIDSDKSKECKESLSEIYKQKGKYARNNFIEVINECRMEIVKSIVNGKVDYDIQQNDTKLNNAILNLKSYGGKLKNKGETTVGDAAINISHQLSTLASSCNYFLMEQLISREAKKVQHRSHGVTRFFAGIVNVLIGISLIGSVISKCVTGNWIPFGVFNTKRHELLNDIKVTTLRRQSKPG